MIIYTHTYITRHTYTYYRLYEDHRSHQGAHHHSRRRKRPTCADRGPDEGQNYDLFVYIRTYEYTQNIHLTHIYMIIYTHTSLYLQYSYYTTGSNGSGVQLYRNR